MKTKKLKNEIRLLEDFHYNKACESLNLVLVTPQEHIKGIGIGNGKPRVFVIWQKDSYFTVYDSLCSFHYMDGIGRLYDDCNEYWKSDDREGYKRDGYGKCIKFLEKYDTTTKKERGDDIE